MFDIINLITGLKHLVGSLIFLYAVGVILGIVAIIALYLITSYKWLLIGQKSGLQNNWMAFVPFARTVYRLQIVGESWWKMFFLSNGYLYGALLFLIINWISDGKWLSFAIVLVTIYFLLCLAYRTYWRYKFYLAHNIQPLLSLGTFVPPMYPVIFAWDHIIAFGNNYPFTGEGRSRAVSNMEAASPRSNVRFSTPAGSHSHVYDPQNVQRQASAGHPDLSVMTASITGLSGMYTGETIKLVPGDEIVIGRDSTLSNLIIDHNADKVSRKHCSILFDASRGHYMVTDYSTNGTFIDGESRLLANVATSLRRGTVIALGNRENRFKLN